MSEFSDIIALVVGLILGFGIGWYMRAQKHLKETNQYYVEDK